MTVNELLNKTSVKEKAEWICNNFVSGFQYFTEKSKNACINSIIEFLESEVLDD